MPTNTNDRRTFLKSVGLSAAALSATGALSAAGADDGSDAQTVTEPARKIPVIADVDVVVVGGGPGGVPAALAAARAGAKVMLVERYGFLGGDADGVAGENDLAKASFAFNSLFNSLDKGKVVIKRANGKITMWKQSTKGAGQEITFTSNKKEYDLSDAGQRTAFANDIKNKTLYVEGYAASTALKDTALTLLYRDADNEDVCEDAVKVTVIHSSLTVYGGDETTAIAIDKEENPGGYLYYNRDDDDKNGTEDRADDAVTGENDLLKTTCAFNGFFNSLDKGKVVIERDNDKIKLWKQQTKGASNEITFTANKKTYDLSNAGQRQAFADEILGKDLWLEGYNASAALKDSGIKLVYEDGATPSKEVCVDPVTLTVLNIEATHVAFNRDRTAHTADGLNIRESYTAGTEIEAPEWQVDGADGGTDPDKNKPACFIKDTAVTVWVRFTCSPALSSANIRAVGTRQQAGSLSLGNLGSTAGAAESWKAVTFTSGVSDGVKVPPTTGTDGFVAFTPQNKTAVTVLLEDAKWQYKIKDVNGATTPWINVNASGQKEWHRLYTILASPVAPWDTADTGGDDKEQPWTVVFDYSCDWASGATTEANAVGPITTGAYAGFGKTYEGWHTHTPGSVCHLTDMLAHSWVDCRDMSAVVQLFTRILGGSSVQVRRVDGPFDYKKILPIGASIWVSGAWNFHQFGWYGGEVYDACLMLKETAPYIPVADDMNGNYKTNLFDSGDWVPDAPHTITTFD